MGKDCARYGLGCRYYPTRRTRFGSARVLDIPDWHCVASLLKIRSLVEEWGPARDLTARSVRRTQTLFSRTKAMLNPSKSDCIKILSAASELAGDSMLPLDPTSLGLSRNGMQTALVFLIERACFKQYRKGDDHYAVGELSLQGRLRLDQLANG